MKVKFHEHAWQCPKCQRWKTIKWVAGDVRLARCCGQRFQVTSTEKTVTRSETVIVDVEPA